MSSSSVIVQRVLPQLSLTSMKHTEASIPPSQQERAELQALIIHQDGSLVGAGITVRWRVSGIAGGQDISFYDSTGQILTMNQGEVTSVTDTDSIATIYAACPSITITTIYVSSDETQPEYGVQFISYDPSGNAANYQAPFISGLQNVLHIPEDISHLSTVLPSELASIDTRYATKAETDTTPIRNYRCAFILNNQCVALQEDFSANTPAYGYIPYDRMIADNTTINDLKYIISETNSGQSRSLHFQADGTAYVMPDPRISVSSNLEKPLFRGTLYNELMTVNSLENGYLCFEIDSFPFNCLYGRFTPILYLNGWDPFDQSKRISRQIHLYHQDLFLQQTHLTNGIKINISQRVFHQIGAFRNRDTVGYAELYLNYIINESLYSNYFYSKADFSGLDT